MRFHYHVSLILGLCLLGTLVNFPIQASAETFRVPRDEPNLESAFSVAGMGDTVLVGPGTYAGGLMMRAGIVLAAEHGPGTTRLVPGQDSTVVRVVGSAPNTAIVGFEISGGRVGVHCERATLIMENCVIRNQSEAGILADNQSTLWVVATVLEGNTIGIDSDALETELMRVDLLKNDIGALMRSGRSVFRRCRFEENVVHVHAERRATVELGLSLRFGNELLQAKDFVVVNEGDKPVQASFNYWGTADCDSILSRTQGPIVLGELGDEAFKTAVSNCEDLSD